MFINKFSLGGVPLVYISTYRTKWSLHLSGREVMGFFVRSNYVLLLYMRGRKTAVVEIDSRKSEAL